MSLNINGIDLSTLSDDSTRQLCMKYNIVPNSELSIMTRSQMDKEIKSYYYSNRKIK